MRIGRFFWFFISILLGAALGVLYGWVINPVRYVNTTPEYLRADYKADYVLMVAEIYQTEANVTLAARRLTLLGSEPPLRQAQRAILTAQQLNYSREDLEILGKLSTALQTWTPPVEGLDPLDGLAPEDSPGAADSPGAEDSLGTEDGVQAANTVEPEAAGGTP